MGQYLRNENNGGVSSDVEPSFRSRPLDGEVSFEADAEDAARAEASSVAERLVRLERQSRHIWLMFLATVLLAAYVMVLEFVPRQVTAETALTQSDAIRLVDSSGTTRVHLQMHSQEPVLQLMDSRGNPRLSLGMRLNDAPFIDLSDQKGRTRASLHMSQEDEPVLRLYDKNGETSFTIN